MWTANTQVHTHSGNFNRSNGSWKRLAFIETQLRGTVRRQAIAFHLSIYTDNKRAFRQNEIGQQSQVIGKAIKMNEIYMQMREVILREEPQTMQCSLWEEGSVCRQLTVGIYGLPSA